MRLFWQNFCTAGQVSAFLSSGFPSGYDASNVGHPFRSFVWKTLTAGTAEYIELQFPSAVSCTSIVLVDHNFVADTLTLKANTSSSWGSPAFTTSITPATGIISKTFAAQNYRYWRIEINKPTSGTVRQIGCILLGNYYDTPIDPSYDGYTETPIDLSKTTQSVGGQDYTETLPVYHEVKCDFEAIDETFRGNLQTITETLGVGTPLAIQVLQSGALTKVFYVKQKALPAYKVSGTGLTTGSLVYDTSITLKEQL